MKSEFHQLRIGSRFYCYTFLWQKLDDRHASKISGHKPSRVREMFAARTLVERA